MDFPGPTVLRRSQTNGIERPNIHGYSVWGPQETTFYDKTLTGFRPFLKIVNTYKQY